MGSDYESKHLKVKIVKPRIDLIPDITYSQVSVHSYPNVDLKMDLLKPRTGKLTPAVIFITGGGFITSNRAGHFNIRARLAQEGYTVASISYRFAPQSHLPAPIIDAKAAVRFLRKNALRFGIDLNKIAVMGTSAGGYLASFVGVTGHSRLFDEGDNLEFSSRVSCVVDLYGVSDLSAMADGFSRETMNAYNSPSACQALWLNGCTICGGIDAGVLEVMDEVRKYNPARYVDENTPPFLLFHGTKDTLVSERSTEIMFKALRDKSIESERYLVEGAGHGGDHWVQPEVQDVIVEFLDKYLKN